MPDRINVTRSFLPPMEEYSVLLNKIWESRNLTNQGPLLTELESKLLSYLKCNNISLQANGTLSIQFLLKSLREKGQIITTPFSYVATTNSVLWEGFEPIFADIENEFFCISPDSIRSKITKDTRAILATHVYGYPCLVNQLDEISKEFNIPVFYDAAHAFGVEIEGKSLLNFGKASTLSFHATKLFHTVEGGAVISNDGDLIDEINLYRSFGHKGENFIGEGINGKMSEIHAAMGLVNLNYVDNLIEERKRISQDYDSIILNLGICRPVVSASIKYNFSYYPIVLDSGELRDFIVNKFNENNIFPRKYFYPSLNKLPHIKYQSCPVAEDISSKVLCLPLYNGLSDADLNRVTEIIKKWC